MRPAAAEPLELSAITTPTEAATHLLLQLLLPVLLRLLNGVCDKNNTNSADKTNRHLVPNRVLRWHLPAIRILNKNLLLNAEDPDALWSMLAKCDRLVRDAGLALVRVLKDRIFCVLWCTVAL
jgi:hypothetical protein